jgi:hypothetical protein
LNISLSRVVAVVLEQQLVAAVARVGLELP